MTADMLAYCCPILFVIGLAWCLFIFLTMICDIRAAKREDEINYGPGVKAGKNRDRRP